tara:strand:+ start:19340 stop:19918 length:579 start_codon:yes stop_codon:yes gene_type:complete
MIKFITVVLVASSSVFATGLATAAAPPALVPIAPTAVTPIIRAGLPLPSSPIVNTVKSYKEWKNEKVQLAIKKVTITKAQIEYRKLNKQFLQKSEPVAAKDPETDRLEALLKNDLYALEVAQELSVTDYFAIYLTKQENKPDAYKEAAAKMTPDEVGQLIKAYADSMFSSSGTSAPVTKVGPTAMEKSEPAK